MPTVDAYGQQKVKTAAIAGVRKSNSAETFESAGGTIAQAQEQLARAKVGVGEAVAGLGVQAIRAGGAAISLSDQIRQRERAKANQVLLMASDRALADKEYELVNGPQGALTVKGKDVLPLHDKVLAVFDAAAGEISKGLPNDEVRAAFQARIDGRRESIGNTLATHSMRELDRYDADETKGYVDAAHSSAIAYAGDNARVGLELQRGEDAIRGYGDRNHTAQAQVDAQVAAFRSGVHVAVIDRMVTNQQSDKARIYFEEVHDQVQGEQLEHVEKTLAEGGLRKQSQQTFDAIVAGGGTRTEQRAKVKALENAELRDSVEARLEHKFDSDDKDERDDAEKVLKGAYDLVDQYHDVEQIPPMLWRDLPGAARSALRGYAENLVQGVATKTDPETFYGLYQKADQEPEKFVNVNLLTLRPRLSDSDFQELTRLQSSIRQGKTAEAAKALSSYRTTGQVVNDALAVRGFNTGDGESNPDRARVARFRQVVDERLRSLGELTGKQPGIEAQGIVDDLLKQYTTAPPSWWFGSPTVKRKFEISVADIPTADLEQIKTTLRGKNRSITNESILELWFRVHRGN